MFTAWGARAHGATDPTGADRTARATMGVEVTVEPAIYSVAAGSRQPTAARPSAPGPGDCDINEVNVAVPQTAADRPNTTGARRMPPCRTWNLLAGTTQAPASGIYAASVAAQVPEGTGAGSMQGSQAPGQSPPASSAPAPSLHGPRIRPPDLPGTDGALVPDPVLVDPLHGIPRRCSLPG